MAGERRLRVVIAALATLGTGIAAYLTLVHLIDQTPACVAGAESCATVADSPYSYLLGVPVSLWGMAGYLMLLASAAVPGETARRAALVVALTGVGFSAYLTYLELFVIEAICPWCVASALTMIMLLVACALRLLASADDPDAS